MLAAVSKALFGAVAANEALARLARRYGMRRRGGPARQFVAGGTLAEALAVAQGLERAGRLHAIAYLGRSAPTFEAAEANVRQYRDIIEAVAGVGVNRSVSISLTRLGLGIDRATCLDNLRRVLDPALRRDCFVRIDAEEATHVAETLDVFEALWRSPYRNIGITLQARLKRTEHDVERMNRLGASIRLVKGAYQEPTRIAYHRKADVNGAFTQLTERLLREGTLPAVATHDAGLIAEVQTQAAAVGLSRDRFEFQMFYGVRRDLQAALVAEGFQVRVSVPFGPEWFPYVMQRLGDRPDALFAAAPDTPAAIPAATR
jgi:proline dehydrogenase